MPTEGEILEMHTGALSERGASNGDCKPHEMAKREEELQKPLAAILAWSWQFTWTLQPACTIRQIKQWSRTRSHDGISDGEDGVRAHILRTTLGEHKQHCCSLLVSPTFHQDGICL